MVASIDDGHALAAFIWTVASKFKCALQLTGRITINIIIIAGKVPARLAACYGDALA